MGKANRQRRLRKERERDRMRSSRDAAQTARSAADGPAGQAPAVHRPPTDPQGAHRPAGQRPTEPPANHHPAGHRPTEPPAGPRPAAGPPAGQHATGPHSAGQRSGTEPPTTRPAAERISELVSAALRAVECPDEATFSLLVAALAGQDRGPGWRGTADRAMLTTAQAAVSAAWRRGWQPAELVRQVSRTCGAAEARMVTDLIAAELRGYAAATIDEGWDAQLAAAGAQVWWEHDDEYLRRWATRERLDRFAAVACVLQLSAALATMPHLARLCPIPGAARRGSLGTGNSDGRAVGERMLGRVRALLAKAESTEFPEEAEALSARAQELMARYSIDYAVLAAGSGDTDQPVARRLLIDNPYEAPKAFLLDVVARANRCRAVWSRGLGMSTVFGFPSDLDGVALLFTSLLIQATAAMARAGSRRDAYGRSRTRSFRQSFMTAYADRIGERLAETADAVARQAVAESSGGALLPVLAAREEAVDTARDAMFPKLRNRPVGPVNDREGWLSGRAAADLAALHGRAEVAS